VRARDINVALRVDFLTSGDDGKMVVNLITRWHLSSPTAKGCEVELLRVVSIGQKINRFGGREEPAGVFIGARVQQRIANGCVRTFWPMGGRG
jgi:hypothetical protein